MRQLTLDGREVSHPPPAAVLDILIDGRHYVIELRRRRGGIDLETQEQIIGLYARGLSATQVAAELFVSRTSVLNVLRDNGIRRRPRGGGIYAGRQRLSTDEMLRTAELYGRGLSLTEVGHILGIRHSAVLRRLQRYGVPRRSDSEALKLSYRQGLLSRSKASSAP